jgi:hypothetical protein
VQQILPRSGPAPKNPEHAVDTGPSISYRRVQLPRDLPPSASGPRLMCSSHADSCSLLSLTEGDKSVEVAFEDGWKWLFFNDLFQ